MYNIEFTVVEEVTRAASPLDHATDVTIVKHFKGILIQ